MTRRLHQLYAWFNNYFWRPCPKCGQGFGGHEEPGGVVFNFYDGHLPGEDRPRIGEVTCPKCVGQWEKKDGEIYPIWGRVFIGVDGSQIRGRHAQ